MAYENNAADSDAVEGSDVDGGDGAQSWWERAWFTSVDAVSDATHATVDFLTSMGGYYGDHPDEGVALAGEVVTTAAGIAMITAGVGGEIGGFALDITGVGAVVGVPVNVASAGVIVAGAAITLGGAVATSENLGTAYSKRDKTSGQGTEEGGRPSSGSDHSPSSQQGRGLQIPEGQSKNRWLSDRAAALGYSKRIPPNGPVPFDSKGQPSFFNGKTYITPDVTGHNTLNGWKVIDRRGGRIGTYDSDLNHLKG